MVDMRISDLPAAPDVNDAQQFEVNDGGNSRRVTFQQLREKIKADFGKNISPEITPDSWDDLPQTYPGTGLVPVLVRKSTDTDNGGPTGYSGHRYYVQQFFHDATQVTQLAIPYADAKIAFRYRKQDGTWSAWRQVLDNTSTITAEKIIDATAVGRDVLKAVDQAAARAAIGVDTSNTTIASLPPYSPGDNFTVGFIPNFGGYVMDSGWWACRTSLRAASAGTIRIRLEHSQNCRVWKNGIPAGNWSAGSSYISRSLDLPVQYGDVIAMGMQGGQAGIKNIYIRTASDAPLMIPINNLSGLSTYVPPPTPPSNNDSGGP